MQDLTLDAKIQKMIEGGADDEVIKLFIQEEQAKSVSASPINRFLKGAKKGAVEEAKSIGTMIGGMTGGLSSFINAGQQNAIRRATSPELAEDDTAGKIGEFAGTIAADLPLSVAAGASGLANIGREGITKALGPAASKAGAFGKSVLAGLPGQVASGVATTAMVDPTQVATAEGLAKTAALSTVGGLFDGIFGVRAFNAASKPGAQSFVEEVLTAPPGTAKEVKNKIDDFLNQFEKLTAKDPQPFTPKKPVVLERPTTFTPKGWEPGKRVIPNSDDVQGYAEEIFADLKQRDKLQRDLVRIMNHVKGGTHSEQVLSKIPKIQEDFDKLSEKIAIDLGRLGKSAEEVRNLVSGGGPSTKTPRTVIKIRDQQNPNFLDPVAPGSKIPSGEKFKVRGQEAESIIRPGSGTQSPYSYIPPEQQIDPLAPVLSPKKLSTPPAWMDENEKEFFNKIDVGNENAAAALKEERYLLDNIGKRLDYKTMDFLRPVKEASKDAYDAASKFLRINMRAQQAIDDAIYIPNGDGTYTRGPESLVPLARRLGGDAEQMLRFNMYAQARQAASGVETPFEVGKAQGLIDKYATEYPEIVEAYEQGHKPLVRGMLDAAHKYGLFSDKQYEALQQVDDYVSLARSAFGDYNASTGFTKGRKNPDSEKLVSDYWLTMQSHIRGLVRSGERANVLRTLAKDRMANPELAGAIDIVPYEKPAGFDEFISNLPKDTPETLKQALADAFVVPSKGNTFPVLIDGKRVSLKLNDELASSLDMMQFRGPKTYNPENIGTLERILTRPAEGLAKTEKAITGAYSVYRDMFGFGVPLDAIEVATNASARGYKFNMLKDPVKGFMALYRDDPALRDLAGHGGLLGFRYANPMAEGITKDVGDIQRLAKNSGLKLRLLNPKAAFTEFAGNLSNASRAGLVLANSDRSMAELSTVFNDIIGDPAKSGAMLSAMAKYTGFMNYPIQATKAQLKALAESPQRAGFFLARAGGQLVAPAIIMWYMTKDDERLQELSKDPVGRRFIPLPNPVNPDEPLMLPKPQGIAGALFVTLPQMMMQELQDAGRTDVIENVYKAAVQNVMPNPLPLTFNAFLGATTGKTFDLTNVTEGQLTRDVVPQGRQGMLPEDAGAAGGSQASQALAQLTGIDAGKWERVLRTAMIGTSYDMYRGFENMTLGENEYKPTNQLTPIPGIRKSDASMAGSRFVNEFYDEYNKSQRALKSFTGAINGGAPDKAMRVYTENADVIKRAMELSAQKSVLDAFNQQINLMKYNEFYTAEEKMEKVRQFNADRIRYAKRFLGKE